MEIIKLGSPPKVGDFIYTIAEYTSFIYKNADGNCKHCYLDSIGSTAGRLSRGVPAQVNPMLELFKNIFDTNMKATFSINVTYKEHIEVFKKYFTMISCVAIPTGYGNGSKQYHAIFFTNSQSRDSGGVYRNRLNKEGIIVNTMNQNIELVGEQKHDKLSNTDIEKILAYKSKYHLRKFLTTKI